MWSSPELALHYTVNSTSLRPNTQWFSEGAQGPAEVTAPIINIFSDPCFANQTRQDIIMTLITNYCKV